MWEKTGIIGRDNLLKKHIFRRCTLVEPPFVLTGPRGVGKTTILEWAYQNGTGPKSLVSGHMTLKEIMVKIAVDWGLVIEEEGGKIIPVLKATVGVLENAINSVEVGSIYVDDLQVAKPPFLRRLTVWAERFNVFSAGIPPFKKEEITRILWGVKEIDIRPLPKEHALTLAHKVIVLAGSDQSPAEIAEASLGLPARLVALVMGTTEDSYARVSGEEIDLAPFLFLFLGALVALRYLGRATGDSLMVAIGGFATVFIMFGGYFFRSAYRK